MAKKGKTRKQKLLTDLRRKSIHSVDRKPESTTYSLPIQNSASRSASVSAPSNIITHNVKSHVATIDYRYLITDLRKTILLTCLIAIAELAIKFLVKI